MNLERLIKYLLPFFVFAIVSRAIDEISFVYYAVPVLCFIFTASYVRQVKSIKYQVKSENQVSSIRYQVSVFVFIIPGLWFLLTSLWSSYPIISASRAIYFILISTGCISAGILWKKFLNRSVFNFLLPANIFIILLCLFSLITNTPSDSWTGGHGKGFMGYFGHQNTLASVLLFTLPGIFGIRYKVKRKKDKIFFSVISISNLLFIILSYSRGVILSILFGILVFLLLNKKWNVIIISAIALLTASVIILITPSLNNSTSNIIKKDFPEFYSSRMWMWEPSFKASLSGGLFGLGYGISDPNIKPGSVGDHYEGERFVREKGNSVLAIVEESGVIGLIFFIFPIIYFIIKILDSGYQIPDRFSYSKNDLPESGIGNPVSSMLIAFLSAFILHAQFEAWWVGVGSVQLPLFFIYIGSLINQRIN